MSGRGGKLSKPKTQNKVRNPFILKKKMKEILDILMSDIWTLSETEEEKKKKKRNQRKQEINNRLDRVRIVRDFQNSNLIQFKISLQNSNTWKIPLAIAIKFIPSKNVEEKCIIHLNNSNKKLMQMKLLMTPLSCFVQDIK